MYRNMNHIAKRESGHTNAYAAAATGFFAFFSAISSSSVIRSGAIMTEPFSWLGEKVSSFCCACRNIAEAVMLIPLKAAMRTEIESSTPAEMGSSRRSQSVETKILICRRGRPS